MATIPVLHTVEIDPRNIPHYELGTRAFVVCDRSTPDSPYEVGNLVELRAVGPDGSTWRQQRTITYVDTCKLEGMPYGFWTLGISPPSIKAPGYQIVFGSDLEDVQRDAERLMRAGWEPQGGVSTVAGGHHAYFSQAMVRRATP